MDHRSFPHPTFPPIPPQQQAEHSQDNEGASPRLLPPPSISAPTGEAAGRRGARHHTHEGSRTTRRAKTNQKRDGEKNQKKERERRTQTNQKRDGEKNQKKRGRGEHKQIKKERERRTQTIPKKERERRTQTKPKKEREVERKHTEDRGVQGGRRRKVCTRACTCLPALVLYCSVAPIAHSPSPQPHPHIPQTGWPWPNRRARSPPSTTRIHSGMEERRR